MKSYFTYDETSPSCLRWASNVETSFGERKEGAVAGNLSRTGWHVQITENEMRHRDTAPRVIWALHHGHIPIKHSIIHLDGDVSNCNINNLKCVDPSTFMLWKAWRNNRAYVRQIPETGRWWTMIRPVGYIGSYDTKKEARNVYRNKLKEILIERGFNL